MNLPLFHFMTIYDTLNRPLRDLRISVTDRCNFRCVYCMPKQVFGKTFRFIAHEEMLSFEEITRVTKLFIQKGVQKIRLTGGEPLLRRHLENLIEQLAPLKTLEGSPIDLSLTTNGSLLLKKAPALYQAGLKRITVSLDALDHRIFKQMNDVDFSIDDVLKGIECAEKIGFSPIKINVVIKKGTNEQEILPIARRFKGTSVIPRFIEYMDVGNSHAWNIDHVLPSFDVIQMIHEEMPLKQVPSHYESETAQRWQYCDESGEIGVISSITKPFCRQCTRARLSTSGYLYPCLFSTKGINLKTLIRNQSSDDTILEAITRFWTKRDHRYSELRNDLNLKNKIEMSYIGG